MFVDDSLSPREDLYLKQSVMTTSPTSSFDRAYLFKISQVDYSGVTRYIIRSMLSNTLSLSVSGNNLVTKIIPDRDEDVSIEDTFYISVFEDGYHITQYESSGVISIDAGTPENLILDTGKISETQSQWLFEGYTGTQRSSSTIYRPTSWTSTGIVVGTTRAVSFIYYSTVVNANIFNVEVAPGYEDIATVSWNPSTRKATITTLNPGRLRINVQIKASDNSTVIHSGYYYYNVVPEEGVYYLQNLATEKYAEVADGSASEGSAIWQWDFHVHDRTKWELEHVSDSNGYVRLKSVYSNMYLGVNSSDTSSIKQYSAINDYTLWKIERSATGNLIFKCKATESSEKAMSMSLNNGSNGEYLIQMNYTDNTDFRDEWKLVLKNELYSFGITVPNNYPDSCDMSGNNYDSFGIYADNICEALSNDFLLKFDRRGNESNVNDLKNKNAPNSTHQLTNADDVDLIIYTGHGYAKNRDKGEGLFTNNCLHFGRDYMGTSHPSGQGTSEAYNYSTNDALYFGYQAQTKWLLTYTCNFLNTAQGDPNVMHMLDNGGRLIMGMGSKMYIVSAEGTSFGEYLCQGETFKNAFIQAGKDNQINLLRSAYKYCILYYGPENGGTLNDALFMHLNDYDRSEVHLFTEEINKNVFNDFELD